MAYEKQTFVNKTTRLTAEHLEHIEQGIVDVENTVSQLTATDVGARPDTWMPTATDVGARPSTWLPTANEINAVPTEAPCLENQSVKDWALSLTGSAYAYTTPTTTDTPAGISASNNYAIVTAKVINSGAWIELRAIYVLTGYEAVIIYNYGWGQWEWNNPPMSLGTEYRTTERYNGTPIYTKLVDFGSLPNATSKKVTYCSNGATRCISLLAILSDGCAVSGGVCMDKSFASTATFTLDNTLTDVRITTDHNFSSLSARVIVKYTIE